MSVKFIDSKNPISGEVLQYAIIDHGNEEYTSMLKSTYDEMIARNEASTL
jgi:hypothetical protein